MALRGGLEEIRPDAARRDTRQEEPQAQERELRSPNEFQKRRLLAEEAWSALPLASVPQPVPPRRERRQPQASAGESLELELAPDPTPYLEQAEALREWRSELERRSIAEEVLLEPERVSHSKGRASARAQLQPLQALGRARERQPVREFEFAGLEQEQALHRVRLRELRLGGAGE